jgi:hypothetical protein
VEHNRYIVADPIENHVWIRCVLKWRRWLIAGLQILGVKG